MRKRVRIDIDYRKDCWWGFKDVRARLDTISSGEEFHFLCEQKMAEKMERLVPLAGGEIFNKDVRSYGVVISVRKKWQMLSEKLRPAPSMVIPLI